MPKGGGVGGAFFSFALFAFCVWLFSVNSHAGSLHVFRYDPAGARNVVPQMTQGTSASTVSAPPTPRLHSTFWHARWFAVFGLNISPHISHGRGNIRGDFGRGFRLRDSAAASR
jgi:hypothetical protein